ncbi:hypothetical protein GCM10008957_54460 [Deinococcus ruber]|uniref:Uncharacterized protein n=1 Tax=Deinococcus ruber TaxID=1848197 RepID=A0A918FHR8_9DEIO|nr:hypothetical protein GCM10008957_54460 [Deinococcus ruber]
MLEVFVENVKRVDASVESGHGWFCKLTFQPTHKGVSIDPAERLGSFHQHCDRVELPADHCLPKSVQFQRCPALREIQRQALDDRICGLLGRLGGELSRCSASEGSSVASVSF